ncbi:acyl-CoA dehydrogenase family protein [Halorubrum trueperi]|uniref:Acyl-CoA dehydrogenase family protein n=1 Tax=Halorubrum trueperi TaxID=2004704 RepID=A0ABD5UJW7_9EURY
MNFQLSDEQELMRDGIRKIAADYDQSYWQEIHEEQRFPTEIYDDLAEGGWLGIVFPEEYGGEGLGLLDLVLLMEALSEEGAWEAAVGFVTGTVFGGLSVLAHGTDEQKRKYLPPIAAGEETWALGVTEPDAGLNTTNISTSAERDGEEFVINGQKQFISGLDEAERMLLLTRTTPMAECDDPREGLTMFIVDPADDAIEYNEIPLDLYFPDRTFQVHITDLRVSEDQILGDEGNGMMQVFDTLNTERITTGAGALGAGLWCLDQAVNYANERVVWSEPIGAHQAIQHPLADAHADLETARLAVRKAAWQYDEGAGNVGEAANVANLQAGKAAWNAAEAAMTTFGGMSASAEIGIAAAWGFLRHSRTAPVTEEMIRNYLGQHVLGLPRSY